MKKIMAFIFIATMIVSAGCASDRENYETTRKIVRDILKR